MEINEIRQNVINNFLNPRYKNVMVYDKMMIINNIRDNSWFPIEYDNENGVLKFNFGNNLTIIILMKWNKSSDNKKWHLTEFM